MWKRLESETVDIKYKVNDQRIEKDALVVSDLKPGTRGTAALAFSFGSEWNGFTRKAIGFSHDGQEFDYFPLVSGRILIPDEYCDEDFYFVLVGQNGMNRMTTEKRKVVVR